MAGRDLKALVEAGLLVAEGQKRGRYYTASPKLKEIRALEMPRSLQIDDPFDTKQPAPPGA